MSKILKEMTFIGWLCATCFIGALVAGICGVYAIDSALFVKKFGWAMIWVAIWLLLLGVACFGAWVVVKNYFSLFLTAVLWLAACLLGQYGVGEIALGFGYKLLLLAGMLITISMWLFFALGFKCFQGQVEERLREEPKNEPN